MTPKQKARELVNQYYNHARSQAEAIQSVDNVLLARLCQDIDNLHSHMFHRKDYDAALIEASVLQLKMWQEVAYEVGRIKVSSALVDG